MLITGTSGRDRLRGTGEADLIRGLEENDTLEGRDGDDTLEGGSGKDNLDGGQGDDRLDGGDGRDRISGGTGADSLFGGLGADTIAAWDGGDRVEGGDGDDQLEIRSLESHGDILVLGGAGNDLVQTQHHGDDALRVYMGGGDDTAHILSGSQVTVIGGAGADHVSALTYIDAVDKVVAFGGVGDDSFAVMLWPGLPGARVVDAGPGADTVYVSGEGRTRLTLGEGADWVRYQDVGGDAPDRAVLIADFATGAGGDDLDMSGLLLGFGGDGGPWDGQGDPFARGFLRLVQDGASTVLEVDFDAHETAYGWAAAAVMADTDAADFTAANLHGYDPDSA